MPIGTASANSVESDLECTSRLYFDNLTSQKPCQYNNKSDCSETNCYNIQHVPQDYNNINFIYSVDRIMDFNRATELIFLTPVPVNKVSFFIHNTTPYIH